MKNITTLLLFLLLLSCKQREETVVQEPVQKAEVPRKKIEWYQSTIPFDIDKRYHTFGASSVSYEMYKYFPNESEPSGNTVTGKRVYDTCGFPIERYHGEQLFESYSYTYDSLGRIKRCSTTFDMEYYFYGIENRVIKKITKDSKNNYKTITEYTYDSLGNLVKEQSQSQPTVRNITHWTVYRWENGNMVEDIHTASDSLFRFSYKYVYNDRGFLSSITEEKYKRNKAGKFVLKNNSEELWLYDDLDAMGNYLTVTYKLGHDTRGVNSAYYDADKKAYFYHVLKNTIEYWPKR